MANEKILLKAKANQLGIEGYRTMSIEELHDAIASAEGKHTVPAKGKGKTAVNGTVKGKGKSKGKSAKTTTASAKGKSKSQKSASAKTTAGKGKASRAASTKGKGKSRTSAKGTAKRTPAKAKKSTTAKTKARSTKAAPARVDIDRTKIDWRLESNVGRTGKREEVMSALRKHKGNYDKTFETLVHRAKAFYPGKSKHDAERMLRWLINRVAFDYVMSTEQHNPGERTGYGQSDKPQDVRRREAREAARKAAKREARKANAPAKKTNRKASSAKGKKTKTTARRKTTTAKGKGRK